MKTFLYAVTFAALLVAQTSQGWAGDKKETASEARASKKAEKGSKPTAKDGVTLQGEMMCGKCALGKTKSCQNVLKVVKDGKETMYFLADNKVSQDSHGQVCGGTAKATVVGKVKKLKGKHVLTASSIQYENG